MKIDGLTPEQIREILMLPKSCILCGSLNHYATGVFVPPEEEMKLWGATLKYRYIAYGLCRTCYESDEAERLERVEAAIAKQCRPGSESDG